MQRPRFKRHRDDRKWQNPINSMTESATSNMLSSAFFPSSPGIPFLLGSCSVFSMGAFPFLLLSLYLLLVSVIMSFSLSIYHNFSLCLSLNSFFSLSYSTPFLCVPILTSYELIFVLQEPLCPFCFQLLSIFLFLFPCRLTDCLFMHT